jgi:hypothetical protein
MDYINREWKSQSDRDIGASGSPRGCKGYTIFVGVLVGRIFFTLITSQLLSISLSLERNFRIGPSAMTICDRRIIDDEKTTVCLRTRDLEQCENGDDGVVCERVDSRCSWKGSRDREAKICIPGHSSRKAHQTTNGDFT